MNILIKSGRYLWTIAMIAFGIQQFIIGKFMMSRVATTLGGLPMAYLTGGLLIIAASMILLRKNEKLAIYAIASIILIYAVFPHIPGVLADRNFGGEWTNLFKALTLLSGAFLIPSNFSGARNSKVVLISRISVSIFFLISGIQHFIFADFVKTLVPLWIPPSQIFWTYFAGIALIAGGVGIVIPKFTEMAAKLSGIMVLIWFVILHLPRAFQDIHNASEWTGCWESLAISGVLLMLAFKHRQS
ncbi:MAG: DoxX family membrane protein [Ferruginibacter sp.]